MSKPSTRQELIDYCLRQLGAPVLEINVDDDQIDDLVDDAIQVFNERHYDGVERMYLKYKILNPIWIEARRLVLLELELLLPQQVQPYQVLEALILIFMKIAILFKFQTQ